MNRYCDQFANTQATNISKEVEACLIIYSDEPVKKRKETRADHLSSRTVGFRSQLQERYSIFERNAILQNQ